MIRGHCSLDPYLCVLRGACKETCRFLDLFSVRPRHRCCLVQWFNCFCVCGLCTFQQKSLVSGGWYRKEKALKWVGWDGGFCFLWPVTTVFLARQCVVGVILSTAGQWRDHFIFCWGGWARTFFVFSYKQPECSWPTFVKPYLWRQRINYSRQCGGPFFSCEIDVAWTLRLLGDELPGRVRVRTWCLCVCKYEFGFCRIWLMWFLDRNMFSCGVLV